MQTHFGKAEWKAKTFFNILKIFEGAYALFFLREESLKPSGARKINSEMRIKVCGNAQLSRFPTSSEVQVSTTLHPDPVGECLTV